MGNQAVRTDGTSVHLVIYHVSQLHEVCHTDSRHLVERFAGLTIIELRLAGARKTCFVSPLIQLLQSTTVEDRGSKLNSQFLTSPSEHSLEDLTDVHTGRHTHRVQHDIYRRTICKERHILYAHDLGYDTLVTMATCHLVTHADLTTLGNIHLGHLDDTIGQFISDSEVEFLTLELCIQLLEFLKIVHHTLANQSILMLVSSPAFKHHGLVINTVEALFGEMLPLLDENGSYQILHFLSLVVLQQRRELVNQTNMQLLCFLFVCCIHILHAQLVLLFLLAILDRAGIEFLVNNHTAQRRTRFQRSILNVSGFVTENSLQQLLFRRRISLSFRSGLTDHDISRLDVSTDTDDTILIQILGSLFGYIRDICGELLHTTFRIAYFEQLLYYMDRSEQVLTDDALAQYYGILIVITLPRYISNLEVLTQCQFATLCSIAFCQKLPLGHHITLANNRMEVNSGVLVGLLKLRHFVFFLSRIERHELLVLIAVITDTDDICIYICNLTITFRFNLSAAVFNQLFLDTGTYDRCLRGD